jgi:hypothetical protein
MWGFFRLREKIICVGNSRVSENDSFRVSVALARVFLSYVASVTGEAGKDSSFQLHEAEKVSSMMIVEGDKGVSQ